MDKTKQLEQFVETIMGIEAPAYNVMGSSMPGNAGSSVSQEGALNSGMDITWQLKQAVIGLANAYKEKAEVAEMTKQAKIVEGYLLGEQLLSVLNKNQVEELLSKLDDIVKLR